MTSYANGFKTNNILYSPSANTNILSSSSSINWSYNLDNKEDIKMSNRNTVIRQELERIYGKGCMFQKAYVSDRLRQLGVSLTYGTYKKKYTLKQQHTLEKRMTYHHLKHKAEGGKTNLENGAIVNELAHRYLHSLPRREEERANDMIREWKRDKDNGYEPFTPEDIQRFEECQVELAPEEEIEFPLELDTMTIQVDKTGIKVKGKKKKKYNRAKHKRKTRRFIKRYYGER